MKIVYRNQPAKSQGYAPAPYAYARLSLRERLYFYFRPGAWQKLLAKHSRAFVVESWMDGARAYNAHLILRPV